MKEVLAIFLIFVMISLSALFWFTKNEVECISDLDCVPATCCHPSRCVPKQQAPNCEGIVCTQECVPGTLDCGQGRCICKFGKCDVEWN